MKSNQLPQELSYVVYHALPSGLGSICYFYGLFLAAMHLNFQQIILATLQGKMALKLLDQLALPSQAAQLNNLCSAGSRKPSSLASSLSLLSTPKPVSTGTWHAITPLVPSLLGICPRSIFFFLSKSLTPESSSQSLFLGLPT